MGRGRYSGRIELQLGGALLPIVEACRWGSKDTDLKRTYGMQRAKCGIVLALLARSCVQSQTLHT